MANKSLKTLDIITVLMKNDRVREFEWLDTRSWEEDKYFKKKESKPIIPNGCSIPERQRLEIKKIENKEDHMDLLLEADPSKEAIHKYLEKSDMYGLKMGDEIISVAVIYPISSNEVELKNLATKEKYRNKGYAKKLLKSLCENYKQKFDKMIVGTTENNIPF